MAPSLDRTPLPTTPLPAACFLACAAYTQITGRPLVVEHSLGSHGRFCWSADDNAVPVETVREVAELVAKWAGESLTSAAGVSPLVRSHGGGRDDKHRKQDTREGHQVTPSSPVVGRGSVSTLEIPADAGELHDAPGSRRRGSVVNGVLGPRRVKLGYMKRSKVLRSIGAVGSSGSAAGDDGVKPAFALDVIGEVPDSGVSDSSGDRNAGNRGAPLGLDNGYLQEYRNILKVWRRDPVPIIRFGEYWDLRFTDGGNVDPKWLAKTQILPYKSGFIVRVPGAADAEVQPLGEVGKLFGTIEEYENWGTVLGVGSIPEINTKVYDGSLREMCWVAEAQHDKKLGSIADAIVASGSRIVCIAGPSSSGKTTFSKKLRVHLSVVGKKSLLVSADDFFLDHVDMDPDIDFEHVRALNAGLLQDRVKRMVAGESVPRRKFNFITGKGTDTDEMHKLDPGAIVIIEGIHMLNPLLWEGLRPSPDAPKPTTIYVTALTQLNITSSTPCSTSDTRLLRRIVRDHATRGYSASDTLVRWPSVRRGEQKWIFPHTEAADLIFNTALAYELPMLGVLARPLLCEVASDDPWVTAEAQRLMEVLSLMYPMQPDYCPGTSLLREFLGGSFFKD